ncbi:MAG TPA: tripartite tricarboxylate transporter substrate binding protein, partial [Casimicrobiaceae bacterium]|nr:tripartite tricarboxylate transporter substrate binding protein [Casimicrobiaceae bacterium]
MTHRLFRSIARWLAMPIMLSVAAQALAADVYPSHAVKIIAPIAAGGPSDTAARLMAEALSRQLGQSVIVENRTGAGGVIGTEAALQAPADGYTLLLSIAATFSIIPATKKVNYDPLKDFVPLGQIWDGPQALVVRPDSKFKTLGDLVTFAKANPEKVSFGSAGQGTTTHLSIVLLSKEADVKLTHVPYRGTSQSLNDLLGGQIDAIFGDLSILAPRVQAGSLRALAVTSTKRSPLLPNVPTTAESGLPDVNTNNWYGLHVHAGTPQVVIDRLKTAVRAAQEDPAYQAALTKL